MNNPFQSDRFTADTTPEAARVQLRIYQNMAPEKRLEQAFEMSEGVRSLCAAGIRASHPEYSERQVKLVLIRRILGEKLFRIGYPHEDLAL